MKRLFAAQTLFMVLILFCTLAVLQGEEHAAKPEPAKSQKTEPSKEQPGALAAESGAPGEQLAEASREAAGEEEGAEFKQSASVKWLAKVTGMKPLTAYWVSVVLNFVVIALLLLVLLKSHLPGMFRARAETIRRSLEEARQASQEAQGRLAQIEARLAKLDGEIAAMHAAADEESRQEGERIRATAEQDKNKIVEAAEQEIAAAANLARRELKTYVAELAVALAQKQIAIAPGTDEELVRSFVDELGKNGK